MRKFLIFTLMLVGLLLGQMVQAAIIIGHAQGQVILTEVMDYQCPHCQSMAPIIDHLIATYPDL